VLVLPELAISTASIFADPELVRDSASISLADALAGRGRNDCEAVVRKRYPQMSGIMASLERWGRPVMTGTGSAIFLPMESRERAIRAAWEMRTLYNVRVVSGLDRSLVHEMLDADGP
jgi:4-diphosphocytidyl-2-C-methyl-D-erythritol kinase